MKNFIRIFVFTIALVAGILFTNCTNQLPKVTKQNVDVGAAIEKVSDDNIIVISPNKVTEKNSNSNEYANSRKKAPGDIICSGSGISFAKCVRNAVDGGKTLSVYRKGGTYYAIEMEM